MADPKTMVMVNLPSNATSLALGDVNGDGKLDLVSASSFANSVAVQLNACPF